MSRRGTTRSRSGDGSDETTSPNPPRAAGSTRPRTTAGAQPAYASLVSPTPIVNSPTSDSSPSNPTPVPCNSCDTMVGNEAIGCDRCSGWFHPTVMCLGIPENSIKEIVRLGGDGILFVCLHCKVNYAQPSSGGASAPNATCNKRS